MLKPLRRLRKQWVGIDRWLKKYQGYEDKIIVFTLKIIWTLFSTIAHKLILNKKKTVGYGLFLII